MALPPPDTANLELLKLFFNALIVVGFALTIFQIKAARRQVRANVLLKMIDEWNSPEFYESVRYVHQLRREWKKVQPNPAEWDSLAESWVEANAPSAGEAPDSNWLRRRRVSQFLSKMGYMLKSAYITREDFFSIAPETRRLLAVLGPIERKIAQRFVAQEVSSAAWDKPFDKLFFAYVQTEYDSWFAKTGKTLVAQSDS